MVPVLVMLLNGALLFLVPPLLILYTTLMILAPFGLSLGVRKKYVQLLLKIFEFGRVRLEQTRNRKNQMSGDGHDHDDDEEMDDKLLLVPDPDSEKKARENGRRILRMGSICEPTESHDLVSYQLDSCLDYIKSGIQAIVDDEVTKRFCAEELKSWNMLTRTQQNYEFISWRLSFLWFVGFFFRYFFLLPVRITIFFTSVLWMVLAMSLLGCLPDSPARRWSAQHVSKFCFQFLSNTLSAVVTYHNPENRPRRGICVANHTTPIDVLVLSCDQAYSLIGQRHSGFLGLLQRALTRASSHIWFERGETKDRSAVTRRLKEHVEDPNKLPILIFPEGTCINNTSVMQFKKGSFEVGGTIYPVAIRYDHRFGDAFWDSSQYSMLHYLFMMMTSWAIVCDVWYLPPTTRQPNESAIDFANRVKAAIASAGGLVDLMWDGQLKRMSVKQEWREKQQQHFTRRMLAINKEIRDDDQREKDE